MNHPQPESPLARESTGKLLARLQAGAAVQYAQEVREASEELARRVHSGEVSRGYLARLLRILDRFFVNVTADTRQDLMAAAKAADSHLAVPTMGPEAAADWLERQNLKRVANEARLLLAPCPLAMDPKKWRDEGASRVAWALHMLDRDGVVE